MNQQKPRKLILLVGMAFFGLIGLQTIRTSFAAGFGEDIEAASDRATFYNIEQNGDPDASNNVYVQFGSVAGPDSGDGSDGSNDGGGGDSGDSGNDTGGAGSTGRFYIYKSQIIDPDGNVFYPMGVNVNGPEAWDNDKSQYRTVGHSNDALRWGFNTVRITTCWNQGNRNGGDYPDDNLEAIINEYTAKKIVVMPEGRHDCWEAGYPPGDEALNAFSDIFVNLANKYKDNPYVWFNPFNEPTRPDNDPNHDTWKRVHERMVRDIRATGNTNIIVLDGSHYGQEDPDNGAILKYGPDSMAAGGNCNVMFSFHVYTRWDGGDGQMRDYINRIYDKDMALMIGETGLSSDESEITGNFGTSFDVHYRNLKTVYSVAPDMGVGILAWHGAIGDPFDLVGGNVAYWGLNDQLSNLTEWGRWHWDLGQDHPDIAKLSGAKPPGCMQ